MVEDQGLTDGGRFRFDRTAIWVGLAAFVLYFTCLCPTVYLGDSGEIASAIASGGIVHPPGYPWFTLLGSLFTRLVWFGEPAWRIGCFVAASAAITVAEVYLVARTLGATRPASLICAAALAIARGHWNQAERVEVYSFHTALLAGATLAAQHLRATGNVRTAAVFAGLVSMGVSHHTTFLLSVPGLLWIAGSSGVRATVRWPGAILWLLGPAGWLEPLRRAHLYPELDWGGVRDGASVARHAASVLYHGWLDFPSVRSLVRSLVLLHDNLPGPIALSVIAGGVVGCIPRHPGVIGVLVAAAVPWGFSTAYAIEDLGPYLLGPTVLLAPLGAIGWDRLMSIPPRRFRWISALGIVAVLAGVGWANRAACDLRGATAVRQLAIAKLMDCPEGALLVSSGDNDTFPLWYAQMVLGTRRDVMVVSRDALRVAWREWAREPSLWYPKALARRGLPVPTSARDAAEAQRFADDEALIRLLDDASSTRPVRATFAALPAAGLQDPVRIVGWLQRQALSPEGMLVRVDPPGRGPKPLDVVAANRRARARFPLPPLAGVRSDGEVTSDYVARHIATLWLWHARVEAMAGEDPGPIVDALRKWAPDLAPAATVDSGTRH